MPLLEVKDLHVSFKTDDGLVRAVNGLSFSLDAGRTLGIVGESGSGKSVTALSIMRLIASPPGKIERGEIWFDGRDLLRAQAVVAHERGTDAGANLNENILAGTDRRQLLARSAVGQHPVKEVGQRHAARQRLYGIEVASR